MQTPSLARDFTFGAFHVSPSRRLVSANDEPARLGARAFDVLLALAARRDRIVSKNELLDVVWPNLVVEENNLQVQIWALRKLFGQEIIATIPGRGYRFTALLDGLDGDSTAEPKPSNPKGTKAAAPASGPPSNLPSEPQPLYGRHDGVAAVCRLVADWRLVTIVGAGGIGKTRIGLAVAHSLRDRYPHGVWLVELAPLADAAQLPSRVAQALGLQLSGQRPLRDELIGPLESQRSLLVLDNCEHLLEAVTLLARDMLARTLHVRLLVTSQEPLKLPGEHLFRLGPLAVPPDSALTVGPRQAIGYGAVRLFVERVQALDPRFQLEDGNVAAVVEICRHLDGLPLAIELAAARVPSLGVTGVRERLGERLRMLTAGARVALRRHQTLRAALDWSHGLLDLQDQAVFRRLSVFSGGCTIEAAQQVAGDAVIGEWEVLDSVSRLVDKSLVVADGEGADRPRYRLLETTRAYALEKTAEADETASLARRHAESFGAQFERLADALYDGVLPEDDFIAARGLELDNLRAAMAWSLGDDGDADTALTLLAHTAPLLALLAPSFGECERWASALDRSKAGVTSSPRRAALNSYAQIHWGFQRLRLSEGRGRQTADMSVEALRGLDDPRRQAHALWVLAVHAAWRGDLAAARAALDEVGRIEMDDWPAWLWSIRVDTQIRVAQMAGEAASATAEIARVLDRLELEGQPVGRSAFVMRIRLAEQCLLQGRLAEAAQSYETLAQLGRRQRRDAYRMCFVLAPLALALTELGQLDDAREVVLEALPLLRHAGMRGDYAPILALLALRRGRTEVAARLLGAGDAFLARVGGHRTLIPRRAQQRVLALLEAAHPKGQVDAWIGEGGMLGEDAFTRLVIQEG